MTEKPLITLLISGNRIVVHPTLPQFLGRLQQELTFVAKQLLYGYEKIKANSRVKLTTYQLYTEDHRKRLVTSLGMYDRVTKELNKMGYEVVLKDLTPHPHPEIFEPQWDRIFAPDRGIVLRYGQDTFLQKAVANIQMGLPCRFDCPPAFGKSKMIGLLAMLLPKARIHVTSKRVAVLKNRIYPELCQMLPDVGMVGGGLKRDGRRVQLYTFDSLPHSDGKADILIIDENQDAAASRASSYLARYDDSVNIGLSATQDMRIDGLDMRVEAMCGPVVFKVTYQEAVDNKMVVPIEVRWRDVIMNMDPCEGVEDSVEKKRWGLWRNTYRNEIIAADARSHPDQQVLITCETVEHALAIKKLLPDFILVHAVGNDIKYKDKEYFKKAGLWPDRGLAVMTDERMKTYTRAFEQGRLKNVIVTTVWNVGVDFTHLEVVCRADGGGSPIMDTQIPGRSSRLNPGIKKTLGIVYDYKDQFNRGFKQKATKRQTSYAANGWKQIQPGDDSVIPKQYRIHT